MDMSIDKKNYSKYYILSTYSVSGVVSKCTHFNVPSWSYAPGPLKILEAEVHRGQQRSH